ncbi:GNAT family N-acetyltransferase [Campylobacter sp.]|uniref:GNAT family N-acetyltransferase n=1 Tax=Campylobacter sp. TaxID=205 RepID=UPI0027050567|nr:GNAT family N-acetyltransferase [Campylobacter sp.]
MTIQNSSKDDVKDILYLYDEAVKLQKIKGAAAWPKFSREFIESEIKKNRQFNIKIDGKIACVWAITFDDAQIWQDRNADAAIYIHRIAVNPNFRGQNLVRHIVDWAKEYALKNSKNFIRLDTVGENLGLIKHYQNCGFRFLGLTRLKDTSGLPAHYQNAQVSLFEIRL